MEYVIFPTYEIFKKATGVSCSKEEYAKHESERTDIRNCYSILPNNSLDLARAMYGEMAARVDIGRGNIWKSYFDEIDGVWVHVHDGGSDHGELDVEFANYYLGLTYA